MEFLGRLGIDFKLLIAQMINFGILLWLLKKFVYKPVIKKIEEDEKELNRAKLEGIRLRKEREEFEREKKEKLAKLGKEVELIIKEAKLIAQKIRDEARKKSERESKIIINQAKKRFQFEKSAVETDLLARIKSALSGKIQRSFEEKFDSFQKEKFQEIFFIFLYDKLKTFKFQKIEINLDKARTKNKKNNDFERKIGPVILEYVFFVKKEWLQKLENLIQEKLGLKIKISLKENKKLISGFRLEVKGMIIESNLLDLINSSLEKQK